MAGVFKAEDDDLEVIVTYDPLDLSLEKFCGPEEEIAFNMHD